MLQKILKITFSLIAVIVIILAAINFYVYLSGARHIVKSGSEMDVSADCILVLGASVNPDGTPSSMLKDRLDKAIELYWLGDADKLLLSGDNGEVEYNEVKAMKNYAIKQGVPAKDIFLDHAGFSTYESMYRAKAIFGAKSAIVVTQRYHEYRALYIGNALGLKVYGVCAKNKKYSGDAERQIREALARENDFARCITKPKPTFLGPKIDLSGNGQVSW